MSSGSFAAAQKRIQACQEARRQEAQAAHRVQESLAHESPISRLPFPLNRTATPLTSLWTTLVSNEGTKPAVRVGQVDAELLDEELLVLLKSQIADALKYFNPHIQDDYSREVLLALRAILFKLSIWDNNASYGAALQGLQYTDARQSNSSGLTLPTWTQKSIYGLITVVGRYAWDKYEDYLLDIESSYTGPSELIRKLSAITSRLSTIHSIAAFTSFLVFLVNGRYRTLTDRLLRLRLITPNAQTHREVSFEYLNRQLVWHAFTEFLLFLLPLVGISRWRRWLARAWKNTKRTLTSDPSASANESNIAEKKGPLAYLPERTCAICYQDQNPGSTSEAEVLGANTSAGGGIVGSVQTDIVNPYETIPCQCIYCFACIAGKIEGEEGGGWSCLRCGETIYRCRPWRGDVLVERTRRDSPKKSVGFVEDMGGPGEAGEETQEQALDTRPAEIDAELGASQWQFEGEQGKDLVP